MKTKIYLAKSNRANPDDVSRVRSLLQKYPNDIEVVEFKGGSYSHKDLKACDVLIVVPDLSEFCAEDEDFIPIGKGLHEQIEAFQRVNQNGADLLIVFETDEDYVSITRLRELDLADCDDYINYSTMLIDQESGGELESLLLHRFVSGDSEATQSNGSNKYMYVIIGK